MLRATLTGRNQNRRSLQRPLAQPLERQIRLAQRKGLHGRLEPQLRGDRQEFLAVRAREIGDGADGALAPEKLVRKAGDVAHVDTGADDPPGRTAASAAGTRAPTGAKRMAASSGSGGAWSELPAQTAPSSRAKACDS